MMAMLLLPACREEPPLPPLDGSAADTQPAGRPTTQPANLSTKPGPLAGPHGGALLKAATGDVVEWTVDELNGWARAYVLTPDGRAGTADEPPRLVIATPEGPCALTMQACPGAPGCYQASGPCLRSPAPRGHVRLVTAGRPLRVDLPTRRPQTLAPE